jgi:hypothetical protein
MSTNLPPDQQRTESVSCPPNTVVTGGGFSWGAIFANAVVADFQVLSSRKLIGGEGWEVEGRNLDTNNDNLGNISFFATAMCASP